MPEDTSIDATEPANATSANLSFKTLIEVAKLINVCSKRGAFNANELEHVGGLYNDLVKFLQESGAITATSNEAGTAAEETKEDQ
jgi:hypothetical protein